VFFTAHAMQEMAKDNLTRTDALNVMRAGMVAEAEWQNGGWRHQVSTPRIVVVVEFDTETRCIVVTAWRRK
jgi:hypothetical protein